MKIIFVYNADSGFMNSVLDIGHKVLSPNTYKCNLCSLTFDVLKENKEWRKFRESSVSSLEFLHKNEFEKKYGEKREYPIVLKLVSSGVAEELISYNILNEMNDVRDLIKLLKEKLASNK